MRIANFGFMQFIDTHTHIYLEDFKEDFSEIISKAKEENVEKFFLPNIDAETIKDVRALYESDPKTYYPMAGLHPCSVKEDWQEQLDQLRSELDTGDYIAVGEIGMDLYWEKKFKPEQEKAFLEQASWAKEKGLPIVIHVRNAFDELFELVDQINDDKLFGIFHCFTGTNEQAKKILNYGGFKLGIGGVVTFKNAKLDKALTDISLENIVLETDAPYLAPHPNRGKRNEPSYIPLIAQKMAEIHDVSIEEVARITTQNAKEVFGIDE